MAVATETSQAEVETLAPNDVLHATLEEVRINSGMTGPVFLNQNGTPYRSFYTAFERTVRIVDIPDCIFHSRKTPLPP